MIRVTVTREAATGHIHSVDVTGHAQFADPGKDIVCAGVSAVTFGTVNAVEALTDTVLDCKLGRRGEMFVKVAQLADAKKTEQVQLLLESMLVMLRTIEQSYGTFIAIQDNANRRRGNPC